MKRPARTTRQPRTGRSATGNGTRAPTVAASGQKAAVEAIAQARRDAAQAENEVAKISRGHLTGLKAAPARTRINHLDDPVLTPADRAELVRSVRSALPRRARILLVPSWFTGRLRWPRGRWFWAPVVAIVLAMSGLFTGTALRNTGERMVVSGKTWAVDWRLPDGSIKHGAWKAGLPVISMGPRDGRILLRYWLNGRGYATTEVDEGWLRRNSVDYVVGPTGGTGVVSSAKR